MPLLQIFDATSGSISAPVTLPILSRSWPVNLYPYLFVLPQTGSILVVAGSEVDIYATTSSALAGIDSRYPTIPDLPVPVSYPQTASFAILSLEPVNQYTPEVRSASLHYIIYIWLHLLLLQAAVAALGYRCKLLLLQAIAAASCCCCKPLMYAAFAVSCC